MIKLVLRNLQPPMAALVRYWQLWSIKYFADAWPKSVNTNIDIDMAQNRSTIFVVLWYAYIYAEKHSDSPREVYSTNCIKVINMNVICEPPYRIMKITFASQIVISFTFPCSSVVQWNSVWLWCSDFDGLVQNDANLLELVSFALSNRFMLMEKFHFPWPFVYKKQRYNWTFLKGGSGICGFSSWMTKICLSYIIDILTTVAQHR